MAHFLSTALAVCSTVLTDKTKARAQTHIHNLINTLTQNKNDKSQRDGFCVRGQQRISNYSAKKRKTKKNGERIKKSGVNGSGRNIFVKVKL